MLKCVQGREKEGMRVGDARRRGVAVDGGEEDADVM